MSQLIKFLWSLGIALTVYWMQLLTGWVTFLMQQIQVFLSGYLYPLLSVLMVGLFPSVDWTVLSVVSNFLGKLDYFVPLSEGVVIAGALIGLWVGLYLYRLAKSMLPSVSS